LRSVRVAAFFLAVRTIWATGRAPPHPDEAGDGQENAGCEKSKSEQGAWIGDSVFGRLFFFHGDLPAQMCARERLRVPHAAFFGGSCLEYVKRSSKKDQGGKRTILFQ
jgi:hypothetical protein